MYVVPLTFLFRTIAMCMISLNSRNKFKNINQTLIVTKFHFNWYSDLWEIFLLKFTEWPYGPDELKNKININNFLHSKETRGTNLIFFFFQLILISEFTEGKNMLFVLIMLTLGAIYTSYTRWLYLFIIQSCITIR